MALAFAAAPSAAQAPAQKDADGIPPITAEDAARTLEGRRIELERKEIRGQELQKSLAEIEAEREEINARLLETAGLVQKSEAKLTAIEASIARFEAQEDALRDALTVRYNDIARLLAALQRMGRNPPPVMITRREDALKMVRSAMLLATAFPEMHVQAIELANKIDELDRVMTDIRNERERAKTEAARLNDMQTRLAGLLETKKQSRAEREAELVEVRKAASEISQSVTDLNELIARLDEAVSRNAAVAAFEQETQRQAAAAAQGAPPASPAEAPQGADSGAATKPGAPETAVAALSPAPPTPPRSVVELAPSGPSLVPGSPGRIKPAIAFQAAKGMLPLPAQGRRILSFGEKTEYGGASKGLVMETRANARVTSPCDGWIVYAGEFRSYGQLLIIAPGGGYHVLVAGLSQIDVQPGQFVLAAEPVGTMGGTTRMAQASPPGTTPVAAQSGAEASLPVLYVEFRKDGHPIDPDPWWVTGHQKVQQ